jgi:hypothetical protein
MDRSNAYFRQLVTEGEVDTMFDDAEQADWNLGIDTQIFTNVLAGAVMTEKSPASMFIEASGPCRAYNKLGQRIYFGPTQTIDCSEDEDGQPTIPSAGNDRWIMIVLDFDRNLTDLRVDGNGASVYYNRDEYFEIRVVAGAEAGSPTKPTAPTEGLILGDILLDETTTQINTGDINLDRRDDLLVRSYKTFESVNSAISGAYVMSAAETVTLYENLIPGHEGSQISAGSWSLLSENPLGTPITITARNISLAWYYDEKNGTFTRVPLLKLKDGAVLQTVRATMIQDVAGSVTDLRLGVFKVDHQGVQTTIKALTAISGVGAWKDNEAFATSLAETIDLSTYEYYVMIAGAGDAATNRECVVTSISHTQDITDIGLAATS